MPAYQELINKAGLSPAQHQQDRLAKIREIQSHSGRPLILYAANFIKGGAIPNNSIDDTDITAFSDLIQGVSPPTLDVILHSPGGLAESAERIVALLREKFTDIRFIIPHTAYSAATLIALSGNVVLMDDRSALGPIDPQILWQDPNTGAKYFVPTQTIIDGFERARKALKADSDSFQAYLPMLSKLDLHMFEICENAEKLSRQLARTWLTNYMLKGHKDAKKRASKAAQYLSDHRHRLSHRRGITIGAAQKILNVFDMRQDPKLRDLIWELYCALEFFIDNTDTAKLYENACGVSWRRRFAVSQQLAIPIPVPPSPQPPAPPQEPEQA
jgi:Serine dehydrogenase proteinase